MAKFVTDFMPSIFWGRLWAEFLLKIKSCQAKDKKTEKTFAKNRQEKVKMAKQKF